jgi:predicted nucleic acid-binding protein
MSKIFIDTNVFVYALDQANPEKQAKARDLLKSLQESRSGVVSTQVFQEFYVVATNKLKVNSLLAKKMIAYLANFETVTVDLPVIRQAIDIGSADQISFWDALIVSSAKTAECQVIWTEDLNHNQLIKRIRIENPFLT